MVAMSTDRTLYKRCETCKFWDGKPPFAGQISYGRCKKHDRDMSSSGHCVNWEDAWTSLRYVMHDETATYISLGWTIVDDLAGTHHGFHAVLMEKKDGPEKP